MMVVILNMGGNSTCIERNDPRFQRKAWAQSEARNIL